MSLQWQLITNICHYTTTETLNIITVQNNKLHLVKKTQNKQFMCLSPNSSQQLFLTCYRKITQLVKKNYMNTA